MTGTAPDLMLASTTDLPQGEAAKTLTDTGDWAAELKLDGIRAVAIVTPSSAKLYNRRRLDITYRYPDIVEHLLKLGQTAILDGEIIVMGPDGQPDFSRAHRRDAQGRAHRARQLAKTLPARFVAFDILATDVDVQGQSYTRRRALLERLARHGLEVNPCSDDGELMWEFVRTQHLEGLVLKRKDSVYRPGRSQAWIKVKNVRRLSAIVTGYDVGEGHRADTFGALHLALFDHDYELVPIGRVGSGFTNADCVSIRRHLDAGDPIVVEVKYLDVSPTGQLRQPVFVGVRNDVDRFDCATDQLSQG